MLKLRNQRIQVDRISHALLASAWVLVGIVFGSLWLVAVAGVVSYIAGVMLNQWVSRALDDIAE